VNYSTYNIIRENKGQARADYNIRILVRIIYQNSFYIIIFIVNMEEENQPLIDKT
jgi:hypothetical protein